MLVNLRSVIPQALSVMKHSRVDVAVRQGLLRGIVKENEFGGHYIAFRGIPYAKPPIGELRFKDPMPPEPWSGVRDASKYGDMAIQIDLFTREMMGSEDCLYLNVYTTNTESSEKRAVMVWIHGGSFLSGSGNDTFYGPEYIVQKDVVLVTLNYRLGVFGFLNLENDVAGGNQAIKDALMALRWVHENISHFGGDPGNITIFGESAGGAIAHYLTMCPLANGLYHKVIAQSGTAASSWAFVEWQKGFLLAEKLGKQTTDPKVAGEYLQTIDSTKLLQVSQTVLTELEARKFIVAFGPSLDLKSPNPFFKEHPNVAIRHGIKVPFLFGFTNSEGVFFTSILSSKSLKQVDDNFEETMQPRVLSEIKQQSITAEDIRSLYFGDKPVSKETIMNYADLISDMLFYRSGYEVADIQTQIENHSTYMYKFSYENKNSFLKKALNINFPGVVHGEELSYLFYPCLMKNIGLQAPQRDSEEYRIINGLTQMWTDFAKTGNPTPTITDLIPIKWMPLKKGNVYNYLKIDKELRMEIDRKGEQRCDWKNKMSNKL